MEGRKPQVQGPGSGAEVPGSQSPSRRFPQMKVQVVCMIVACTVMVDGQTGPSPAHKADDKQPATGLYQRQAGTRPHEQKDGFFTASTKLVNQNDIDYGPMLERRPQAFLRPSPR